MVKQAEQNAAVDKERREKIDRKNQADSLAYQAEKQLSDLGDKVPAADKTKVEGWSKTCGRLRTTMSGSRHSCLNCNRLCLLSAATSINKVVV